MAERFDIALSYAGEQREVAEVFARTLQRVGYSVFYDVDQQSELLGQSLGIALSEIYGSQSRYCIILISEDYARKQFPKWEFKAALARHARQDEPYILPFRIDDARMPGLPADIVYGDLRRISVDEACAIISQKLGPSEKPAVDLPGFEAAAPHAAPAREEVLIAIRPAGFLGIVLQKGNALGPVFNLSCDFENRAPDAVTLHAVQARIIDPNETSFRLNWTVFYTGEMVMRKTSDAHPVLLRPGEQRSTGVQFAGPASLAQYLWPVGAYEFDLLGWLEADLGRPPAVQVPCRMEIPPEAANALAYWRAATDDDWRRLNDPDNAVAIPIEVAML